MKLKHLLLTLGLLLLTTVGIYAGSITYKWTTWANSAQVTITCPAEHWCSASASTELEFGDVLFEPTPMVQTQVWTFHHCIEDERAETLTVTTYEATFEVVWCCTCFFPLVAQ